MSPQLSGAAFGLLILVVIALFAGMRRQRRSARSSSEEVQALRKEAAALRGDVGERDIALEMREAETQYLVEHQIPVLLGALWKDQSSAPAMPLHPELADTAFGQYHQQILAHFQAVTQQAAEHAETAAQAAVRVVTRSMQSLLNEQQSAVTGMLERHHDKKVLEDAIDIDHASNQLARRATIIGVLSGSWPGRQRVNSQILDVVRGGKSRIKDYARIQITGEPSYSVVSQAVEPVVLALAELMDNAARHSEPGSNVQIWFALGHHGLTVFIDDAGVGLRPEDKGLAAHLLSGAEPVRLTQLRNPPRFGFAAVGALASRYGFQVSVNQESNMGGVRASLFLPASLLVTSPQPPSGVPGAIVGQPITDPAPALTVVSPAAVPEGESFEIRHDGLPQRRAGDRIGRQITEMAGSQPPTSAHIGLAAAVRGRRRAREDRGQIPEDPASQPDRSPDPRSTPDLADGATPNRV